MNVVSYTGLSKAEVLCALFNASQPMGMGVLQAAYGPQVMDVDHAERLISGEESTSDYPTRRATTYFDYVYGRPLKLNLGSDDATFDSWGFDRDNGGEGTAQRIISALQAAKG